MGCDGCYKLFYTSTAQYCNNRTDIGSGYSPLQTILHNFHRSTVEVARLSRLCLKHSQILDNFAEATISKSLGSMREQFGVNGSEAF
ncbi:hypothetical protein L195_g046748 [Trifolium pratense]|uniref:Uncharacterized protein n=1 Tax=Trifolium pratense TaxID=57577 RepID=A0A2K3MIK9_TRIPR|nr:hypothetical protein L195_g046748 [Trifolium pratense]